MEQHGVSVLQRTGKKVRRIENKGEVRHKDEYTGIWYKEM